MWQVSFHVFYILEMLYDFLSKCMGTFILLKNFTWIYHVSSDILVWIWHLVIDFRIFLEDWYAFYKFQMNVVCKFLEILFVVICKCMNIFMLIVISTKYFLKRVKMKLNVCLHNMYTFLCECMFRYFVIDIRNIICFLE